MAVWLRENNVITNNGLTILSKLESGEGRMEIIKVSSGAGYVIPADLVNQTVVTNEQQNFSIVSKDTSAEGSAIRIHMDNLSVTVAYQQYQIGVFVNFYRDNGDGTETLEDANVLYIIAQCSTSSPDTVPAYTDTPLELSYTLYINHATLTDPNTQITITLDDAGSVSLDMVGNPLGVAPTDASNEIPTVYLKQGGLFFSGTCTTAAGTATKIATVPDAKIIEGGKYLILFSYTNTANTPTLNINNTAAYPIDLNSAGELSKGNQIVVFRNGRFSLFASQPILVSSAEITSGTSISIRSYTPSTVSESVRQTKMTGFAASTTDADVTASDTVLQAAGKLQGQINLLENRPHMVGLGKPFPEGISTTAASVADKVAFVQPWDNNLTDGIIVKVVFSVTNTAVNPTLNVTSSGPKQIRTFFSEGVADVFDGSLLTASTQLLFMYNQGFWILLNPATLEDAASVARFNSLLGYSYGGSTTEAATQDKVVTLTNVDTGVNRFRKAAGSRLFIVFNSANTSASPRLIINGDTNNPVTIQHVKTRLTIAASDIGTVSKLYEFVFSSASNCILMNPDSLDKKAVTPIEEGGTGQTTAMAASAALGQAWGGCTNAGNVVAKTTTTISGFSSVFNGAIVGIYFNNANTASNPTLNVSNTGDYPIRDYRTSTTVTTSAFSKLGLKLFMYYGGIWFLLTPDDVDIQAGTGLVKTGNSLGHSNSITAGNIGPTEAKSLTYGDSFIIPNVTYDSQGHIVPTSSGANKTMTLPEAPTMLSILPKGNCPTDAATVAKAVTVTPWNGLNHGTLIRVTFTTSNTAASPTLNVNGTGAVLIKGFLTGSLGQPYTQSILPNVSNLFMYDANYGGWMHLNPPLLSTATSVINTNALLGYGYGTCTDNAATVAKSVTLSSVEAGTNKFMQTTSSRIFVRFSNGNTADNPMLSVHGEGSQAIYHVNTNARISASDINTPNKLYLFVDATNWICMNPDSLDNPKQDIVVGQCNTAVATAAKEVTIAGVTELVNGLRILVEFNAGMNSAVSPTLNVNNLGAKAIGCSISPNQYIAPSWLSGSFIHEFIYDSAQNTWICMNPALAYNSQSTNSTVAKLGFGFGTCNTSANLATKTVFLTNAFNTNTASFNKTLGVSIFIKFSYVNTADSPTLDVNYTNASSIQYIDPATGTLITLANSTQSAQVMGNTSKYYHFVWDSVYWRLMNPDESKDVPVVLPVGQCPTIGSTATKTVDIEGVTELYNGLRIQVEFNAENTAASPTLNVNGTGPRLISDYTDPGNYTPANYLRNAFIYEFIYDSTQGCWICMNPSISYSYLATGVFAARLGYGYGTCATLATTAAKSASLSNAYSTTVGYRRSIGSSIYLKFTYVNTAASPTLNVNNTGAASIYYTDPATGSLLNINTADRSVAVMGSVSKYYHFIYDGYYWQLLNPDEPKPADIVAGSATKLANARTIQTNLASTSAASFNGAANVTPGVTGVLPIANGGTGQFTVIAAAGALGRGYGVCNTAAGTAAKTVSIASFNASSLVLGAIIGVFFSSTSANTAASPTLNVSSIGAKTITNYYTGDAITGNDLSKPGTKLFMYDGNWVLLTPDSVSIDLPVGQCTTVAPTTAKTVSIAGVTALVHGLKIKVEFTETNTAPNPTLNVNGLGARIITEYTRPSANIPPSWLVDAYIHEFLYDATQSRWICMNPSINDSATSGGSMAARLGFGYGTCTTTATTAAKIISLNNAYFTGSSSYNRSVGSSVFVKFSYVNVVNNPTINVHATGASPIRYINPVNDSLTILANYTQSSAVMGNTDKYYHFVWDGDYWRLMNPDILPYNVLNASSIGIGSNSLSLNTGNYNTALGDSTLTGTDGSNGSSNVAVGYGALTRLTTGSGNVAVGNSSLIFVTTGENNVAVGTSALSNSTTGTSNTAVGYGSLSSLSETVSNNVALGRYAGFVKQNGNTNTDLSNSVYLGSNAKCSGSDQVQIGDGSVTVYAASAITVRSDARDKTDISPIKYPAKEFILNLKPSQYRYDKRDAYFTEDIVTEEEYNNGVKENPGHYSKREENEKTVYIHNYNAERDGSKAGKRYHNGFIAQEVKALADELNFDFAGFLDNGLEENGCDVLNLKYEEFIAPMVQTIQEQNKEIEELKTEVTELKGLVEQLLAKA